jgi:hypothetical protein
MSPQPRAVFVGLYSLGGARTYTRDEYERDLRVLELQKFGQSPWTDDSRQSIRWFDLSLTEHYANWKGKLVIGWPRGRLFWRWADRNTPDSRQAASLLKQSGKCH